MNEYYWMVHIILKCGLTTAESNGNNKICMIGMNGF